MLIDNAKIYVKAGDGGNGCSSFRREKFAPMGGPNGGNGGNGGDVILKVSKGMNTLLSFRYKLHFKVPSAGDGEGNMRFGKYSDDMIILIPVGTVIRDASTGDVIADMDSEDDSIIVAYGGKGGKGNAEYVSSTNQAPKFAQTGIPGEEVTLILELRLFADIGLVGLPNAGKSTLLSRVSAAKPKIADYPFTTLEPQLGVVQNDQQSYIVADIPGIVEDAHAGKGLGFEFLKHIEKTSFLLFMVDISETTSLESPLETFMLLKNELKQYSTKLASKGYGVVGTKSDVMDESAEGWKDLKNAVIAEGNEFFTISSVRGDGIEDLIRFMGRMVDNLKK